MSGVGLLFRTIVWRDRWQLLLWSLGTTLLYWSQAVSVDGLYATQAEFDRAAASMEGNAALVAMAGPARALNTIGGQVTWQATAFGAIVVGLMSMFLVGRHTRAEEESGRDELVRATAVSRFAPMHAAALSALLANVVIGVLVAVSLATYPLPVTDSVAIGAGLTLCGAVFTGTAMVAAQLTASTRSMYGLAGLVIGVAYLLRAVGDVGNPALSWLSPIGWYQAMRPYSGLRWWPALLLVAGAAVTVLVAYAVFSRRDVGSGVLAARPGPARASRGLRSGLGLAWRLQRGSVAGWSAGLLAAGLAYGSIGNDAGDMMGDSQLARDMLLQGTDDMVDGFLGVSLLILGLLTSGFAIASALRARGEEGAGRAEALLATALSRRRWLLGHVTVTVGGTILVLVAAGVGLGAGHALVTGDSGAVLRLAPAILPYVAPVLVLAAVARFIAGVAPRAPALAWLPLLFVTVVMLFAPVLRMPQWLQEVSPFEHLALVPAESFRLLPVAVLLAVAAAVSAAGQVAFARRDLR